MQLVYQLPISVSTELAISPAYLKANYLLGVKQAFENQQMDDQTLKTFILQAQRLLENLLGLKLMKALIDKEQHHFQANNFKNWGFLKAQFPITEVVGLEGWIGDNLVATYPAEWVMARPAENNVYSRNLNLVPNRSGITHYNSQVYTTQFGAFFQYIQLNNGLLPCYWRLSYYSGWAPGQLPADILAAIGKLAAIQALAVLGELQFPIPGVSNTSLSLDGLSQSISTAISGQATVYSARIKLYGDQLTNELKQLVGFYKGLTLAVM